LAHWREAVHFDAAGLVTRQLPSQRAELAFAKLAGTKRSELTFALAVCAWQQGGTANESDEVDGAAVGA